MFDDRLRKLRESTGLNMRQVSAKLGIPYTTYIGYEKNEREPNSETLLRLASFFGCTVDYLVGLSGSPDANANLSNAHPKPNRHEPDITLTPHERKMVEAYLANPAMQTAIDRILNIVEPVSAGTQPGDIAEDIANTIADTLTSSPSRIKQK